MSARRRLWWMATALPAALLGGCEPESRTPASLPPATRPVSAPAGPVAFLAAVGHSHNADSAAAAGEATKQALTRSEAAAVRPAAAVFLGRAGAAGEVGGRIKELAGCPTFGQGGTGAGGLTVLLLAGEGLSVRGFAAGGEIDHDDADDPAKAVRVRRLREACAERGDALARQLPKLTRPGVVLLLGAMEGDWLATFVTAFHKRLGTGVPVVAGAGTWGDRIYLDGRDVGTGQLAVVVQGDLRVAVEPLTPADPWDAQAVAGEVEQAARKVHHRLGPARCGLVLAFHDTSFRVADATFDSVFGADVPAFRCGFLSQAGTDAQGKLSAGTARLVLCGVAAGR